MIAPEDEGFGAGRDDLLDESRELGAGVEDLREKAGTRIPDRERLRLGDEQVAAIRDAAAKRGEPLLEPGVPDRRRPMSTPRRPCPRSRGTPTIVTVIGVAAATAREATDRAVREPRPEPGYTPRPGRGSSGGRAHG